MVSIGVSWGIARNLLSMALKSARMRVFRQAHERNVTICVAAGDSSEYDGEGRPETDDPAGDPYAVAVGGTSLFLNLDGSIQQERAWGDGNPNHDGSGGGWNPDSLAADWQVPVLRSRPDYKGFRAVPDWSWPADPATGVEIFANGMWQTIGGTSAGAPAYAAYFAVVKGVLARESQLKQMAQAPSFGHPGAILYPAVGKAFRDIVIGSNGLPATAGYDLVTGLGSLDGEGALQAFQDALLTVVPGDPIKPPVLPPVAFDPTPAVEGVFANWRKILTDARSRRTLAEIENDVLLALRPPHMVEAHAAGMSAFALSVAVQMVQELVRRFGPLALQKAEAYIAGNTRLDDAQKAFLKQLLDGLIAGLQTPAAPHAERGLRPEDVQCNDVHGEFLRSIFHRPSAEQQAREQMASAPLFLVSW